MSSQATRKTKVEKLTLADLFYAVDETTITEQSMRMLEDQFVMKKFVSQQSVFTCPRPECKAKCDSLGETRNEDGKLTLLFHCKNGHLVVHTIATAHDENGDSWKVLESMVPVDPLFIQGSDKKETHAILDGLMRTTNLIH